ncbi:TonB-dependent receptor plug domain-containing protein, partial [Novosphingobium mangrovi (ex Hu et al. 2023)]
MKIRTRNTLLASAMALTPLMMASGGTAWAQEAPTAAEDEAATRTPGVITVTARKRSESALDVPVAISAYSGEDLNALNVQTVEELTAITPGMNLNNSIAGSARSDRSQTALIIRGMAPSRGNRTSSTFINGVPISDGTVTGIFDFDHVEVLK